MDLKKLLFPAASPAANGAPAQSAPPPTSFYNMIRPRPEAIQNVLVHPVTSLATLAAMDALVLREAGIDPEMFFNTQKRRALRRTSTYRGITRHHGRWQARIKDQRRDIHLGYFDTGELLVWGYFATFCNGARGVRLIGKA
jgi:hypothetical protein